MVTLQFEISNIIWELNNTVGPNSINKQELLGNK